MKSPDAVANHPMACLQRELVSRLRTGGSMEGVERTWALLRLNPRLWKRVTTYGLDRPDRQLQLKRIAFPGFNWPEVDAPLRAGNKLPRIYELARGSASIARDAAGHYKIGAKGLKFMKHWRAAAPATPRVR